MKMTVIAVAAVALAGSFGSAIAAGDAAAGKAKFAVCAGCHGPTGAGNEVLKYPKLAGRDAPLPPSSCMRSNRASAITPP